MPRKRASIPIPLVLATILGYGVMLSGAAPERQDETERETVAETAVVLTTTLPVSKDNTLYEEGGLSNGAGNHFFAGNTNADSIRRGLIAFDTGTVLTGSTIISATLALHVSQIPQTGPSETEVEVRRVSQPWGEGDSDAGGAEGSGAAAADGDATWIHTFYDTDMWTNPGGDFAGTASATTVVGNVGFYTWSSANMVADAQHWLDTPADNAGWILLGDETTLGTARRFDTHDINNEALRPVLTVVYEPPAAVFLPFVTRN